MVQGFADSEAELIWSGRRSRKLPADIQNVALRKRRLLNQARVLGDLRVPPAIASKHLERIARDSIRSGQMINGGSALSGMKEDRGMSKSSTITSRSGLLHNPHPGEILLEEFLKPMGLSQNALARAVHVAPRRINEIVLGKRDVTARQQPSARTLFWPIGRLLSRLADGLRSDAAAARNRPGPEKYPATRCVTRNPTVDSVL